LQQEGYAKVAVAADIRSGSSLQHLPSQIAGLRECGQEVRFLFLDAKDETLIKRFSETRRNHPLSGSGLSLEESIREERRRMEPIAALGHRIDTSELRASALREWIRQFARPGQGLTLTFQSFGFKLGIPLDADLVFDVRCLPNPHYEPELKPLTGRDAPVIEFLEAHEEVRRMRDDIQRFIATWLPGYIRDNRHYLTVAIGCTGGQHRSVYLAEWLARAFAGEANVLVRHRSLA